MAAQYETRMVWVRLMPAPDVRNQWLAYALDFDWMTDGRSRTDALERLIEGLQAIELDDRAHGKDFCKRERAPLEEWPEFVLNEAFRVRFDRLTPAALRSSNTAFATMELLMAVPVAKTRMQNTQAIFKSLLDHSFVVGPS